MKLLLLIVLGITLAEAKPKKPERTEASECTDTLPEEACQMLALNRACIDNDAAQNCRKTCKVCTVCEDTSEFYCQAEKDNGLLDCSSMEHADYCKKTCGKCSVQTASRSESKAGTDKLRADKTGCEDQNEYYCHADKVNGLLDCTDAEHADFCKKTCGKCNERTASRTENKAGTDKLRQYITGCNDRSSDYCRTKKANGMLDCSRTDEADYCPKTCGKCSERTVSQKKNKAGTRKLSRSKRGEDDCTDDEDSDFCSDFLIKGICNDPAYKAEVKKCARTCGLCYVCEDMSSLCGTSGIDVCGQEELEHFCLKDCSKCSERSLAHAWTIRAKRAVNDPEAGDPLAHLLREKTDCEDISKLCDKTDIDVCDKKSHLLHFCLKTCDTCNAQSIARSLIIMANMATSDKEVEDPLARLMRQETDPSSECSDISPICPHNKETDICEREELVHYCLKTCGKCKVQSMERALEMFAKLAEDHPDVKDPLVFLLRKNKGAKKPSRKETGAKKPSRKETGAKKPSRKETDCLDISAFCSTFLDNTNSTVDVCAHDETLVYCLKSCDKCNQRSKLPSALMTAIRADEDPLMDLVRLETCVDKSAVHCMKVANDNYCEKEELAKECPKTCGLCGKKKRSAGVLLNLHGKKCKDDVKHCKEIQQNGLCESFETNHICKLTCGLCKP